MTDESDLKTKAQALKILIEAHLKTKSYKEATRLLISELEPLLGEAQDNPHVSAMLVATRQKVDDKTIHKDTERNI